MRRQCKAAFARGLIITLRLLDGRAREPGLSVARLAPHGLIEIGERGAELMAGLENDGAQHQTAARGLRHLPPRFARGLGITEIARIGIEARQLYVAPRAALGERGVAR